MKIDVYITPDNTVGIAIGDTDQAQIDNSVNLTLKEAKTLRDALIAIDASPNTDEFNE